MKNNAVLLMSCPDRRGIVASVSQFLYRHGANIIHADQHLDKERDLFFMRIEWAIENSAQNKQSIAESFQAVANEFAMEWKLFFTDEIPRVAIFVSGHFFSKSMIFEVKGNICAR